MTEPTLTFTIWPATYRPADGKVVTCPWEEFARRVVEPAAPQRAEKDHQPVMALATFEVNYRDEAHHDLQHGLLIDFDSDPDAPEESPKRGDPHLSRADIERAFASLRHFAYTTWSHAPGRARWRVGLPFDRPVPAPDLPRLAAAAREHMRLAGLVGYDADPSWEQVGRSFYVPVGRVGYEGYATPASLPAVPVDAWLAVADRLEREKEAVDWDEPVPLQLDHCPEPFPVDALPELVRRAAEALAVSYQVSPALPGALMLALLAGGLARKATVELKRGWREPLVFWACVVLRPGSRKSPLFGALIDAVTVEERRAQAATGDKCKEVRAQRKVVQEQVKRANRAKDDAELAELERKLEDLVEPPSPTFTAADATPEAVAKLLHDNDGRLTLASAEGVIFQHMTGLYSREGRANLDVYLQAWGGERVAVHRRHADPLVIPAAYLSVALAVQPLVLKEANGRTELGGRGILQRFGWAVPPDLVGTRDIDAPELDERAMAGWARTVGPLWRLAVPETPATIHLDVEAHRLFRAYRIEVERRSGEGGDLETPDAVREWASKAPGMVARLAGILAAAEAPKDPDRWRVGAAAMEGAIRLVRFFEVHTRYAMIATGVDPRVRLARRILKWLAGQPDLRVFTVREAHVAVNSPGLKVADVTGAIKVLEEAGYVRQVEPAPYGGKGRRPPPGWAVNPRWTRN